MARLFGVAVALAAFIGCGTAPKREKQSRPVQVTTEAPQSSNTPSDENCGLDEFPASRSTQEILASVSPEVAPRRNQMMIARVAINAEGEVSHLRVIRLAWPKLSSSYAINMQAVDSIKRWHYAPTLIDGKAVAVCSEVSVNVDLE